MGKRILLIVPFSFLTSASWLGGLLIFPQWPGLEWIGYALELSVLPLFFFSLSVFVAGGQKKKTENYVRKFILSLVILWPTGILCFDLAGSGFSAFVSCPSYAGPIMVFISEIVPLSLLSVLVLSIHLHIFALLIVLKIMSGKWKWIICCLAPAGYILTLPLSLISRFLIRRPGYATGIIESIKAGHPFFWGTLLVSLAALISKNYPDRLSLKEK